VETNGLQAVVYLLMIGVLLGLYKGDKGWGRTVLFVSLVFLGVMLVMFAPQLFPGMF
jgi:hypothetical protein